MCHLPVFYGKLLGMESHSTRQTAWCFSAVKLGQYLGGCIVKSCHVTIVMGCSSSSTKSPSRSFSSRIPLYWLWEKWCHAFHLDGPPTRNHAVSSWAQPALTLISFFTFMLYVNYSMHLSQHSTLSWFPPNHFAGDRAGGCGQGSWLRRSLISWKTRVSSTWLQVLKGRATTSKILKPTSNWTFLQSWHFQMHDNPWSPQELVEETWRDAGTGLNIPVTVKKVERLGWRWDDCR